MFQVELIWNREHHFVPYGDRHNTIDQAITYSKMLENMGDGERVKSTRIVNDAGDVVYAYGKRVKAPKPKGGQHADV